MVRNLVGAMIDVGREKRNLVEVKEALDNYEIPKQFMTAPSCGLYLKDIEYKKENINLKSLSFSESYGKMAKICEKRANLFDFS